MPQTLTDFAAEQRSLRAALDLYPPRSIERLDEDVRAVSAFHSYADLLHSIETRGYVPTLRTDRDTRNENEAVLRLRARIKADGYRVHPTDIPTEAR